MAISDTCGYCLSILGSGSRNGNWYHRIAKGKQVKKTAYTQVVDGIYINGPNLTAVGVSQCEEGRDPCTWLYCTHKVYHKYRWDLFTDTRCGDVM